ncbi:RNA polymerase sigma factor [Sphingobacterium lactis]|uniref:RNA polymerase sigma factor SigS n=1 Tax=Sphingobacterium lactis TaxID=797291 RepID=A0A1H6CRQ1_9SPHI|nr:RNA polymerase sigma factor [Sphingobacterium lactis]SEG75690.1 RNA polymerase sigma-70 factor, ECF subfamily [Sphingobacterium lactis]
MDKFKKELWELRGDLLLYANYLTKNRCNAEDLVQNTFLRAIRFKNSFEPGTNFRKWIFTILINTFRNEILTINRRKKVQNNDIIIGLYRQKYYFNGSTTKFALYDIFDSVNSLSITNQKTFKMYLSGYLYKEIADTLNISENTIKTRIRSSKFTLRKILQSYRD